MRTRLPRTSTTPLLRGGPARGIKRAADRSRSSHCQRVSQRHRGSDRRLLVRRAPTKDEVGLKGVYSTSDGKGRRTRPSRGSIRRFMSTSTEDSGVREAEHRGAHGQLARHGHRSRAGALRLHRSDRARDAVVGKRSSRLPSSTRRSVGERHRACWARSSCSRTVVSDQARVPPRQSRGVRKDASSPACRRRCRSSGSRRPGPPTSSFRAIWKPSDAPPSFSLAVALPADDRAAGEPRKCDLQGVGAGDDRRGHRDRELHRRQSRRRDRHPRRRQGPQGEAAELVRGIRGPGVPPSADAGA